MGKIVAIDGPAGSGKGTVAKILAAKCNLVYIDTGAMYRAVSYLTLKNNIAIDDEEKIVEIAKNSKMEFVGDKLFLNGEDVSKEIRTMEVTKIVSQMSSIVKLREVMVDMQRALASSNNVIMEGRDITTVVFPNADYKFYLDATIEERAKRRFKENQEKGIDMSYEEVYNNIEKRDYNDMHKEVGSLMRTDDQIYIDSSNLTVEEEVAIVEKVIKGDRNEKTNRKRNN